MILPDQQKYYLLSHISLDSFGKYFFLNHSETVTSEINTGTSTKGPITVVNATGEAKPKVAIATAKASSKLLPAAVKEIAHSQQWFCSTSHWSKAPDSVKFQWSMDVPVQMACYLHCMLSNPLGHDY